MKGFLSAIFPFYKFELESSLTRRRVIEKVSEVKGESEAFDTIYRAIPTEDGFVAMATESFFSLVRGGRSPIRAIATVTEREGGSTISVLVRPHVYEIIGYFFLALWGTVMLILNTVNIISDAVSGEPFDFFRLSTYLILLLPLAVSIPVRRTARNLKGALETLLIC